MPLRETFFSSSFCGTFLPFGRKSAPPDLGSSGVAISSHGRNICEFIISGVARYGTLEPKPLHN